MFPPRLHTVADFGESRFGRRRREPDGRKLEAGASTFSVDRCRSVRVPTRSRR
jgi:hypothetical protein